jgi:hypothetical protein
MHFPGIREGEDKMTAIGVRGVLVHVLVTLLGASAGCSQRDESPPPEPAVEQPAAAGDAQAAAAQPAAPAEPAPAPAETAPAIDLLRAVATEVATSSAFRDDVAQIGRMCDGDLQTAWNSRTGDLAGAWIAVTLPAGATVTGIEMTAGFTKASGANDLFTGNHRVRRVRVTHDGATVGEYPLDIESRELQRLPVSGGGGEYRITLADVVAGTHASWREACVSELRVLGAAPGAREGSSTPTFRIGETEAAADAGPAADAGADAAAGEGGLEAGAAAAQVPEMLEADGLRVTQLATATAVENAAPVDPRGTFSSSTDERVYCFVRLENVARAATQIYLAWEQPGHESGDRGREFDVPARPRFATYAYLTTGNHTGPYSCVIRSAQGSVIGRIAFEILEGESY